MVFFLQTFAYCCFSRHNDLGFIKLYIEYEIYQSDQLIMLFVKQIPKIYVSFYSHKVVLALFIKTRKFIDKLNEQKIAEFDPLACRCFSFHAW